MRQTKADKFIMLMAQLEEKVALMEQNQVILHHGLGLLEQKMYQMNRPLELYRMVVTRVLLDKKIASEEEIRKILDECMVEIEEAEKKEMEELQKAQEEQIKKQSEANQVSSDGTIPGVSSEHEGSEHHGE